MGRMQKSESVGSTLAWSVEEIVMHYRQAADKYKIIGILAELNNVEKKMIRDVLYRAGIKPGKEPAHTVKRPAKTIYMMERGGKVYTLSQVKDMTGMPYATLWRRAQNGGTVDVYGTEYQVVMCGRRT